MTQKTAKKAKQCDLILDLPDLSQLKVTAADIKKGKQSDGAWCPIALAVRRECARFPALEIRSLDVASEITLAAMQRIRICTGKEVLDVVIKIDLDGRAKDLGTFVGKFDNLGQKGVKPLTLKVKQMVDTSVA